VRNAVSVKTFALELQTIKLLKGKSGSGFAAQLEHVWKEFRDRSATLSVEDPANPSGNDLSELLTDVVRSELSTVARRTLELIDDSGWEAVFGPVEDKSDRDKREGRGPRPDSARPARRDRASAAAPSRRATRARRLAAGRT